MSSIARMSPVEKVFESIARCFGTKEYIDLESAEFVAQLFAWHKLVEELSLSNFPRGGRSKERLDLKRKFHDVWQSLDEESAREELPPIRWNQQFAHKLNEPVVVELWSIVHSAIANSVIDYGDVVSFLLERGFDEVESGNLPPDMASLLLHLANPATEDSIYCPFFSSLTLAQEAGEHFQQVSFESPKDDSWPALVDYLGGLNVNWKVSDPVHSPSYHKNGALRLFDVTLAHLPPGTRYKDQVEDWYQRFPASRFFRGELYQLYHILAQTKKRAVIMVADSFLQRSAKAERTFRRSLLERNWLDAVIRLGDNSPHPAHLSMSILVVDKERTRNDILFADGEHDMFIYESATTFLDGVPSATGKNEDSPDASSSYFAGGVVNYYRHFTKDEHLEMYGAKSVLADDLDAEEDCILDVRRYVRSNTENAIYSLLEAHNTVKLGEITTLIRPQAVKALDDQEQQIEFNEVAIADIPDGGYLGRPRRKISVSKEKLKVAEAQELKPFDILLSIKGTIGKVGIVPPDLDSRLLANQSFEIIRLKERPQDLDPRTLCLYLRSRVAQDLLKERTYEGRVPMVQKSDLERFPVMVPSSEEQKEILETFEEEAHLMEEIAAREAKIKELDKINYDWWLH